MKNSNFEKETKPSKKKKKSKLIKLKSQKKSYEEIEYEKYYDRIRLLSRGL